MRLSRDARNDSGIGMVLVLGMGAVLSGLMIVSTTAAVRSVQSSRQHVSFESALAAADGGIDQALARAQKTYVATGMDGYLVPSSTEPTCTAAPVAWPFTVQPTTEQERTWAKGQLETLAGTSTCLRTVAGAQYVVLKPTGRQSVYAMAWSPRRGAPEVKARILKGEYLFTPYAPSFAVLTGGDLSLDASTMVTTAPGSASNLASVHTNGTISVTNGNPSVTGPVTQAGANPTATSGGFASNPGGAVTGGPRRRIPFVGALAVWGRNRLTSPPGGWYDLCPLGTVRLPDGAAPCAGTEIADVSGGGSFRGWSFTPGTPSTVPVWSAGTEVKTAGYSGTYYVSEGDVANPASNDGPPVPNLTVIASKVASVTGCAKRGGNISWGSTDPLAPSVASTWLVADQDLRTSANYQAGSASGGTVTSGFFVAGDQVEMSTSSNGAYGAVLAADECDPTGSMVDLNSIKNPSLYYDPNAQAPFTDVINNTLWLEYPR